MSTKVPLDKDALRFIFKDEKWLEEVFNASCGIPDAAVNMFILRDSQCSCCDDLIMDVDILFLNAIICESCHKPMCPKHAHNKEICNQCHNK